MSKIIQIKWLAEPEEHDYPAALSYLKLILNDELAEITVKRLLAAKMTEFKAKDIFRASQLSLLGVSNSHVNKNLLKIKNGDKMSPLLLVQDQGSRKVIVADGYHRLCAVYHENEDALIPSKIVGI